MARLTRRESALSFLAGAPLDMETPPLPPARKKRDPHGEREWKLQAKCIKEIHIRQRLDKNLAYLAPGATQNNLKPAQRAFAKMQGWQAGLADIWLMRRIPGALSLHIIELKLPGKHLSPEQREWFDWFAPISIPCSRVDNIVDFCKLLDAFCA